MTVTRFGIVGCGQMGKRHAKSVVAPSKSFVSRLSASDRTFVSFDYGERQLTGLFGTEIVEESFPAFDAHRAEIIAFAQAVRGEGDPLHPSIRSTYPDAVRTLAFTLAGNRSLETAAWEPVEVD